MPRLIVLSLMLLTLASAASVQAQEPVDLVRAEGKLSPRLTHLAEPGITAQEANQLAQTLSLPATGGGSLHWSAQGEVQVYIRVADTSPATLEALSAAGARITTVAEPYARVVAFIAPANLPQFQNLAAVHGLVEALQPATGHALNPPTVAHPATAARPAAQVGCPQAITSEGDSQLNAAQGRFNFGVDGSGVTVAILSDSMAQVSSPTSYAQDVARGDLPGSTNPCGRTQPVNIADEGDLAGEDYIDEGRAMLQIIHDLAPGADLVFRTAFDNYFSFAANIRNARFVDGADIIADDIFYFRDPFFQDGALSQAITAVVNDGASYFTIAGNFNEEVNGQNISSYEAVYRPTNCPVITVDGSTRRLRGDCHDFNPDGGVNDPTYAYSLGSFGRLSPNLQWAEPWDGVVTDIDLYILDSNNVAVARSTNFNLTATQEPFEYASFSKPDSGTANYAILINRYEGNNTPRLKYIFMQTTFNIVSAEYSAVNSSDIFGPSIYGKQGASDAITIAAVPYNDNNTPQPYSALGNPTYYFGPTDLTFPFEPGASTGAVTRGKPNLTATDAGCNSFFGTFDFASFCYRFNGTSAATPHAAAVAALVLEEARSQGLNPQQWALYHYLWSTARPISNGGGAPNTGFGLIDANAALSVVGDDTPLYLPTVRN